MQKLYLIESDTGHPLVRMLEIQDIGDSVVPEYRKRRSYISSLLSKNEVDSANPYCRKLFKRKRKEHYILSPKLSIRQKDGWLDVYSYSRIDLIPYSDATNEKYFLKRLQILIAEEEKTFPTTLLRSDRANTPDFTKQFHALFIIWTISV